jgi:hypothetical protein
MLRAKCIVSPFILMSCVLANCVFATPSSAASFKLGNDDTAFTFAGHCPNGERYRIFSYQRLVENIPQSFYDYEGPVGRGTVRTDATPKTMSVRVCRKLAEIINTNYWE